MTTEELISILRDAGMSDDQIKGLSAEKLGSRAASLRQGQEYEAISSQKAELEKQYEKSKTYQDWYAQNYQAITNMQQRMARYEERYGDITGAAAPTTTAQPQATSSLDEKTVEAMLDKKLTGYSERWSSLLKGSGEIFDTHRLAGRKNKLDMNKIAEIAAQKGGDLVAAYEEWDKPEREKEQKSAEDARVEQRAKEMVQKMQTAQRFPAGADGGSSGGGIMSRRSSDGKPKEFDEQALLETFVTGQYDRDGGEWWKN